MPSRSAAVFFAPPVSASALVIAVRSSSVAPFPGIHGWYWLNETDGPVTVTLHAAGFFTTSTEFLEGVAPIVREITETPDSTAYRPYF